MTLLQLFLYIGTGIVLSGAYLFLLWLTILVLPKIKHKSLLLLSSFILRLSLFLAVVLYISQKAVLPLLLIVASFIFTRFIVVKFIKLEDKNES